MIVAQNYKSSKRGLHQVLRVLLTNLLQVLEWFAVDWQRR